MNLKMFSRDTFHFTVVIGLSFLVVACAVKEEDEDMVGRGPNKNQISLEKPKLGQFFSNASLDPQEAAAFVKNCELQSPPDVPSKEWFKLDQGWSTFRMNGGTNGYHHIDRRRKVETLDLSGWPVIETSLISASLNGGGYQALDFRHTQSGCHYVFGQLSCDWESTATYGKRPAVLDQRGEICRSQFSAPPQITVDRGTYQLRGGKTVEAVRIQWTGATLMGCGETEEKALGALVTPSYRESIMILSLAGFPEETFCQMSKIHDSTMLKLQRTDTSYRHGEMYELVD